MKNLHKYVFFSGLFLFISMMCILNNTADRDIWHRMAVGKVYFQTGSLLMHDVFSYMPTKPLWVDHEWGSGVIFYYITHCFGDYGLLTLKILVMYLIMVLIYQTINLIYPNTKYRIFYFFIAAFALYPGLACTLRCQAFTYLFFTLWIYVLERIRRGENRLIWIFPATMLLWCNMHGGFLAGIGLICIYAVGEFLNKGNYLKYLGILALTVPVTLINPYGYKYLVYMAEAVTMPRPLITEWKPLDIKNFYNEIWFKILYILAGLGFSYKLFIKDKKTDYVGILVILVTLYLTFKHERHVAFASITLAVFGYEYFSKAIDAVVAKFNNMLNKFLSEENRHKLWFTKEYCVYLMIFMFSIYSICTTSHLIKVTDKDYAVTAIDFIKVNNLKGNLFVPFNWGSYAMWKLYPQCLISIDGRYEEVYTNEIYMMVSDFTFNKKNWDRLLRQYHTDIVLVDNRVHIDKNFTTLKNWRMVYKDKYAIIYVPTSNKKQDWIIPKRNPDYYAKTKYENTINFG